MDLLTCPESRVNDHSVCNFLRRRLNIRNLAAMRPVTYSKHGKRQAAHGCVSSLNFSYYSKHLRTRRLHAESKGLLVHTVQLPECKPLAMIVAYLPGPSSPQRDWAPRLIDLIIAEHKSLSARFGSDSIFITFDANRALGSYNGRHTCDPTPASEADPLLVKLCKALDVSPLHGRSADCRAHVTSRNIDQVNQPQQHSEDGREIDFILGSNKLDASRFLVLPPGDWSDTNSVTHREIFVEISCTASDSESSGSGGAGAACSGAHCATADGQRKHDSGDSVRGGGGLDLRMPRCPDYDDPRHFTAGDVLLQQLRRPVVQEAIFRSGSVEEAMTAMKQALLSTQQQAWAPNGASAVATDQLRADPLTHAGPPVLRRWKGHTLPVPIASLFALARNHKKAAYKATLRQDLATADTHSRLAKQYRHEAQNAARKHIYRWQGHVIATLEHRRSHNAHSLFSIIRSMRCDDPTVYDGNADAIPDDPAIEGDRVEQRFFDFFGRLIGGGAANRPALQGPADQFWDQFIPWAPARRDGSDPNACLSAPVTAEEVYLIVYPASKRIVPDPSNCPGGVSGCSICTVERAGFETWDGNPDSTDTQPSYGPCMHTSTAAGPDGILAEVIRFSRNRAPERRHRERMVVCAALATICNKILAERAMPASACENRSVPLFKDGDRSDPNDYRFITIGDLLQKIWSLVMVRRITHWAVGNCVISLPQRIGGGCGGAGTEIRRRHL